MMVYEKGHLYKKDEQNRKSYIVLFNLIYNKIHITCTIWLPSFA